MEFNRFKLHLEIEPQLICKRFAAEAASASLYGFSTNSGLKAASKPNNPQKRHPQQLAKADNRHCFSSLMLQKEHLPVKNTKPSRNKTSLIVRWNKQTGAKRDSGQQT